MEVELLQQTSYPETGNVRISITPKTDSQFTLSLRIPSWSKSTQLLVNGQSQACEPGTYATINRVWTRVTGLNSPWTSRPGDPRSEQSPKLPWRAAQFYCRWTAGSPSWTIARCMLTVTGTDMFPLSRPRRLPASGWRLKSRPARSKDRAHRVAPRRLCSATTPRRAICSSIPIPFGPGCPSRCSSRQRCPRTFGNSPMEDIALGCPPCRPREQNEPRTFQILQTPLSNCCSCPRTPPI